MKIGKVIRKTTKILLITILSLFILILVLVGIAINSEKTITDMALEEVSSMFDAPFEVDGVKLLIFRSFPYLTVEFTGFNLGISNKDKTDTFPSEMSDTILSLRKFYVSLKTRPLLKNKIEVKKVEIEGFAFNYYVNSKGKGNLDFLMASDTSAVEEPDSTIVESAPSILDVLLNDLTIRDVTVNFKDDNMRAAARIQIPEMDISGRILDEYYKGSLKGKVIVTKTKFEDTHADLMNETSLAFKIDYEDGKVEIESVNFLTDGAKLIARGSAVLGDSVFVDMGVDLLGVDFKELSKYAPDTIFESFGLVDVRGKLDVRTKINGYVYDSILLPHIVTNVKLYETNVVTKDYPELKGMAFDGVIDVPNPSDMTTMSADFKYFNLATKESTVNLVFKVTNFEKPSYNLKSDISLKLDEFNDLLPDSTVDYITGEVNLKMSTYGVLPADLGINSADYFLDRTTIDLKLNNICTALDAETEVKDFSTHFTYNPSRNVTLENLTINVPSYKVNVDNFTVMAKLLGKVRDMDNMGVNVDSLYFKMGNTNLVAKATVDGLKIPKYTLQAALNLDLDELRPLIPDTLVKHISGKIAFNMNSYGTVDLDSIETQMLPIAFEQTSMGLKINDFSFEMPDDTLTKVDRLDLDFAMANDTIKIQKLYALAQGIDFKMDSTEVWNVYKAFMLEQRDKKLIVNTHISLGDLSYAMFEPFMVEDSTAVEENSVLASGEGAQESSVSEEAKPALAENKADSEVATSVDTVAESYMPQFIARGTFAVNSFKYGNILLEDLSTKFRVDDSLYVADEFKLKAFGGEMNTSAVYDTRQDTQIVVYFKNTMKGLDIYKMLVDGENFDQEEFTSDNITGIITSEVDGRLFFTDDFDVIFDQMIVKGDFKLENGAIYNYKPLAELSKMPMPGLKGLDSLIFQTLNSQVFIYKNSIYFPKTDIVSSATDISAYGMQSFDDDYQYHLKLYLRDVFFSKNKKLLKEQGFDSDEKEDEKGERKGLELVAKDIQGDTKYGADTKSLQRLMNTKIRLQNRGLSLIFNPRLVNFSTNLDRREGEIE